MRPSMRWPWFTVGPPFLVLHTCPNIHLCRYIEVETDEEHLKQWRSMGSVVLSMTSIVIFQKYPSPSFMF